jgi:hypothetical protein
MGKMADTVLKRNNKAEQELEARVMQAAKDRDEKNEADDKRRKQILK